MSDRCCPTCTAALVPKGRQRVGAIVRIERDQTRWPSKGSWSKYRGRSATIVSVNVETLDAGPGTKPRNVPFHVEYGIAWKPGADLAATATDAWFLPHEVAVQAEKPA